MGVAIINIYLVILFLLVHFGIAHFNLLWKASPFLVIMLTLFGLRRVILRQIAIVNYVNPF